MESSTYREIEARGYEKGLRESQDRVEKGLERSRMLMLRLLRAQFGELPHTLAARVRGASEGQLDRWTERLVTADSVEAVFEDA